MDLTSMIVILLAVLMWLSLTALGMGFRRALGGWLAQRRAVLVAGSPFLALPWLLVPDMKWEHKALVVLMLTLNWVDGHQWTKPGLMLTRYSWMPALVTALLVGNIYVAFETWELADQRAIATVFWITMTPDWRWTPLVAVGPLIAGVYWLVQRPAVASHLQAHWTPSWDRSGTTMLDGPISWAELGAGGITYAIANGIAVVLIVRDILA